MADIADALYKITNKWMLQPLTDAYPQLPCPNVFRKGLNPGWRVLVTFSGGKVTSVTKAPPEVRPAPAEAAAPPVAPATRPVGRPAAAPAAAANRRPPGPRQGNNRPNNAPPQGNVPTGYFQNPYNFVPFSTAMRTGELAEAREAGPLPCDRAHADRYSAKLAICFTTVTPLLTMEVSDKEQGESAVYTVRRDDKGKPIINGASVKGMLRSLYEQVTGSRLGIFNHPDPLSVRSIARDALDLTMVKVDEHKAAERRLVFVEQLVPRPTIPLPAEQNPQAGIAIPRSDVLRQDFGARVFVWLQLQEHNEPQHLDNRGRTVGPVHFYAWEPVTAPVAQQPAFPSQLRPPRGRYKRVVRNEPLVLVEGTLHNTGRTIKGKRHERLFVDRIVGRGPTMDFDAERDARTTPPVVIPKSQYDQVMSAWRGKLEGFATEVPGSNRSPAGDRDPVTVPVYVKQQRDWSALPEGRTLYCRRVDGEFRLYPALITREAFSASPAALLGTDLAPAGSLTELTAAERVFGWVPDREGEGQAVRGRLRVGGVRCLEEPGRSDPTATTWQLVPLNSPKPSHARFYTRETTGDPLNGMKKGEGYKAGQHLLAGHKVYPHQQRPATYWSLPAGGWPRGDSEHPQDGAHFLNFLAARGTPPEVAMAIRDWVAPGASFATTLYVQDVTLQELLALLWVLDLSAPHEGGTPWHLKLGQGKPLGFGSIQLRVDWSESSVLSTAQTKARYGAARAGEPPAAEGAANPTWADQIAQFDERFRRLAPATYLSIKAAAEGSDLPTHYPRVGTDQGEVAPQVETYQWFVDNEGLRRHALPLLTPTPTTPVELLPTNPRAPRGRPATRTVR
nr:TIGR03986 family CRISPR-associated RAMP protein [Propionibacterium sp.]